MMDDQLAHWIITRCVEFTKSSSTSYDPRVQVTTIQTLNGMLSSWYPDDLLEVLYQYGTLDNFFNDFIPSLELNHTQLLCQYSYQTRGLPVVKHDGSAMFVITKDITEFLPVQHVCCDLDKEIREVTTNMAMTNESYVHRNEIRSKLNTMLNNSWFNRGLQVSTFGSTATGLGTDNADLDLCISGPCFQPLDDPIKLKKTEGSIYNMTFLARKLRKIGMRQVKPITAAHVPICKFRDPRFKINCDINTNNLHGIENTNMIIQYMHLDTRIRPVLFALKLFIEAKEINNTRRGFLNSYAFILIALHYLMYVQEPPVIPCLQNLSLKSCITGTCNNNEKRTIQGRDVRYHSCIRVVNTMAPQFDSKTVSQDNNPTLWYGKNTKNVGDLILELFAWMSNPFNLVKPMSLTINGHVHLPWGWKGSQVVFPDPFDPDRNIARSCTSAGVETISQEFKLACDTLNKGLKFMDVLKPNNYAT
ncbi:uncharacterized protein EV154DRAFT_515701 [Mucor mucedo]|uniref:uncharacterized protein n=1 Tax=Mucor mucedo TaxID=29922 RepID=UPI0022208704|nr:uncharacterized protein EV154DRAFT_515701 [Mucor mucedo]KAI7889060.1 hypothetical protein EV154DRAFT_515701 [Mucor mucedo]